MTATFGTCASEGPVTGSIRSTDHCPALPPTKLVTGDDPIRLATALTKSEAWWQLSQDERRATFEETSHHIAIGISSSDMENLPAVARRLHHGRDLDEPFDFLTWFEFPQDAEPPSRNWCGA
jgi:hypothetical protein